MEILSFSLPEKEKPLLVVKSHWSSYLAVFIKAAVAILLIILFVFVVWPLWWEEKWGRLGLVFLILVGSLYVLLDYWKRFLTAYIITRCRLIDITQEKINHREITEIGLEEVDDIVVKKSGLWDKIMKKGRIVIKVKGGKGVLVFYDVKKPERVEEVFKQIQEDIANIVDKEGKECSVILEDDKTHRVPLSFSYYGDKKERMEKKSKELLVVKKKNAAINEK